MELIVCLYISGQLFMLNVFLGTDYHMFGVNVVMSLIKGQDWRTSTKFPRVTLCDFEVIIFSVSRGTLCDSQLILVSYKPKTILHDLKNNY